MSGFSEQASKSLIENVGFDPVAIALEDGVPVAEQGRKIAPWASRPHNPKHRFDKAPVVASAASGVRRLPQAMRFHLRPLGLGQYISVHPKLESQSSLGELEASVRSRGGASGVPPASATSLKPD